YALVLNAEGSVQIVRELDGRTVLAEVPFDVEFYRTYQLEITVAGTTITASVDGETLLETEDDALATGGIALLIDEGRTATQAVTIAPVDTHG
ncbi:MAG: ADP-ribosylglycohydrolase family protein, partial [Gammaproteobacteria bacterium]|nr:ADP-ribosylglycohydrolase family protein [Gammaproteobacteria bacterium]